MTHSDTQNDTSDLELRELITDVVPVHLQDKMQTLIAQREQAAELRGRTREAEQVYSHIEALSVLHGPAFIQTGIVRFAYERLQATKPEKGD